MDDLSHQAISASLRGNWQLALEINLKLLEMEEESPQVLNRLARAYAELGKMELALTSAKRVLKIDPLNTIAQRSLEKWSALKNGDKPTTVSLSAQMFLEEPGKTKIVSLVHLSKDSVILTLECGQEAKIMTHPHSIVITTLDGRNIGKLTDDIANRMKKLIDAGNTYACFIKCANRGDVKVFIREIKRADHIKHIPSFPTEKVNYVAFASPELVHKKPKISL